MNSNATEQIAQAIKGFILMVACGAGCGWILANETSEQWRLGALVLGFLAIVFALATIVAVLSLLVGFIARGVTNGFKFCIGALMRWYAFRRLLALLAGSTIGVVGGILVTPYDPLWAIVPAVVGAGVTQLPRLWETLKHQGWFARLFRSGREPRAEFAQVYHLKKYSKSFGSTFKRGAGYCSEGLFIGTSTRESS